MTSSRSALTILTVAAPQMRLNLLENLIPISTVTAPHPRPSSYIGPKRPNSHIL